MKIRIYNNDGSDYADYVGDNIEEIKESCKTRRELADWREG